MIEGILLIMRKILSLILLLVFLTGCGITGRVVEKVEKQMNQEQKDLIDLNLALSEKDVAMCYQIQTQPVREQCFMLLAKELDDASICRNLMGSLRTTCKTVVNS